MASALRRLSLKNFISTFRDSAWFISVCFTAPCRALMLGYFMVMTRIPMILANSIAVMAAVGMGIAPFFPWPVAGAINAKVLMAECSSKYQKENRGTSRV